jgi:hypothetical protein
MKSTLLLDHDLEGFEVFLLAGLRETGWDQIFSLEFKRLREYRQRVANRLAFCSTRKSILARGGSLFHKRLGFPPRRYLRQYARKSDAHSDPAMFL